MPKSNLNADEQARIKAGECACGCGEPIPRSAPYLGSSRHVDAEGLYASQACRQRAYRNRAKRGEVRTREQRRADALRLEAASARRAAEHAESTVRYYTAEAARLRKRAAELDADADGQIKIPGLTERPRRRAKGTDVGAVARPSRDVEAVDRDTAAPELARHVEDPNAGEDLRAASRPPAPCDYCGKPSTGQTMARAEHNPRREWRATCATCGEAIYNGRDPSTVGTAAPVLGAPAPLPGAPALTPPQRELLIRVVDGSTGAASLRISDGRDKRVIRFLESLRMVNTAESGALLLARPTDFGRAIVARWTARPVSA